MKKLLPLTFVICIFTFYNSFAQSPPPSISSFTPSVGPGGTVVKIIGSSFNPTIANNVVFFGATRATVTAVTSNTLTVTAPVGATYQYITVTDPTYPGTAYATKGKFVETFSCGGAISAGSFTAKTDFTTASAPYGNGLRDIDGDGKADVVTANGSGASVSVFRNTSTIGTISFAAKVDFTTGTTPTNVAFGDINGDGKTDIVTCNNTSGTVSVFKNQSTVGNISFAAKVDFTVGTNPWMVAVNDMNADGNPDIIVANKGSANVGVLRNTSSISVISFVAQVTFPTGVLPFGLAVGDLDLDGKPDIVTANQGSDNVSVLRNTGGITFAAKVDFTSGDNPVSVAIGDLDADGNPEIASANANGTSISVFKNTGNLAINVNTFLTKIDFTTGFSPWCVAICDLDGDGKPDLASANTSGNSVSLLRNTTTINVIDPTSFAAKVDLTAGTTPYGVSLGDLDNDGKPDVAAVNNASSTISCYRNLIYVTPTMTSANTTTICSGTNVSLSFASDMPSTYQWIAANNPNTSGESTTLQTGNILNNVIVNNTFSVQVVTYTVTPTSIANGCGGTAQTLTVTLNPLPQVSFSGLNSIYCYNASSDTLTGNPVGGTFSGPGISTNTFTPSVAGAGTHTVTYTYTNGNGCTNSSSQIVQVSPTPTTPSICLVTVDSTVSKNNLIVWDKTSYVKGDTFFIYRDTANNAYGLIGTVPFDSLSLYTDTARTIYAANGDPNITSWRYKIAVKDTCGNMSAKSLYHQSIYIQNSSGNFNWNDYKIEGQPIPVPALTNYIFQRDNLSNGNYVNIGTLSASSTAFTDPNYSTFQNTATWRVKTVWTISCTATIVNPKDASVLVANLNSSKSNAFKSLTTSVNLLNNNFEISILPNPSSGFFVINSLEKISSIEITNLLGEKIYSSQINSEKAEIDLSKQPKGIYFIKIIPIDIGTEKGIATKKLVVQ